MLRAFLKDLLNYLPSKLLPAITGFIITPILTRLFIPAEYGYWALAGGVSDFLFALACSGIGAATVRFYETYKHQSKSNDYLTTLTACLLSATIPVGILSIIIIILFRGSISTVLYPLLLISVLLFIIQAVYSIFSSILNAQEKSRSFTVYELLTRYGGIGLGLFLVIVFGLRIEGLLWGSIVVYILIIPFVIYFSLKGIHVARQYFKWSDFAYIWRYALPLSIGNMAMWGLRLSDRYVIALFRPDSDVGLYSVAYNLSGKSVDIIVGVFGLSMFPILMNLWENKGREAAEDSMKMFTRVFLILSLPVATGMTLLASPIVSLFTTPAYHDGYLIVGYVAFSSFFWQLSQIASYGLLIKTKTKQIAINQIVAAVVNLGLNFIFVPRYGFVAAGITTLIGYLVLFILQAYTAKPYLTWKIPWKTVRNTSIANILMCVITLGIYSLSGSITDLHTGFLFISIAVAAIVYFVSLGLLGELNDFDKPSFLNKFTGKLGAFIRGG